MIIFLVKFLNITQNLVTQRVLFQLDVLSDMSTDGRLRQDIIGMTGGVSHTYSFFKN